MKLNEMNIIITGAGGFIGRNLVKGLSQANHNIYAYYRTSISKNIEEFKKSLPMKRLGEPEEIGNFVKSIIENEIKYLSGVVINFDGANSNYIF